MIEITWLGHGTYKMRLEGGKVVLVDPWIEGNPAYPKDHNLDRVDIILVSHGQFDHIHDVLPLAQKFSPQIVAIYETAHWLESKGAKNTIGMNKGGTASVGPVAVTMTHAVHSCGILDDGKIVCRQGDPGDAAYLIIDGEADIVLEGPAGPLTVATLGANEIVGEMSILTGAPRNATVRAKGRLVALRIAKDPFMRMVREFPTMAVSIMQELAHRVEANNNQLRTALSEVRRLREQVAGTDAAA